MIKVYRDELLEERDGKWYWKGREELFSGMMYYTIYNENEDRDDVVSMLVKEGMVTKPYINPYLSKYKYMDYRTTPHIREVDVDDEYDEEEQRAVWRDIYDDSLVTAVTYLGTKYLSHETFLIEGKIKFNLYYFESGELQYFEYDEDGDHNNDYYREKYLWHEDGSYKFIDLGVRYTHFEMDCPQPNILRKLSIDKFYYENMERFKKESFVGVIEDKSYFKQLRAGVGNDEDAEEYKRLLLFNDGIDDEIFQNIWSNGGMEEVEELTIWRNNLTKHSFYKLLDLPNLKEVSMEFEKETMSEDAIESGKFVAKELKAKGVKVDLEIDGKEREV